MLALERELRAAQAERARWQPRSCYQLAALVPATGNATHYARLVVEAAELREALDWSPASSRAAALTTAGGLAADPALRERLARLQHPPARSGG